MSDGPWKNKGKSTIPQGVIVAEQLCLHYQTVKRYFDLLKAEGMPRGQQVNE
jgi:hypothetical protein